jgi:hypothetical protein
VQLERYASITSSYQRALFTKGAVKSNVVLPQGVSHKQFHDCNAVKRLTYLLNSQWNGAAEQHVRNPQCLLDHFQATTLSALAEFCSLMLACAV